MPEHEHTQPSDRACSDPACPDRARPDHGRSAHAAPVGHSARPGLTHGPAAIDRPTVSFELFPPRTPQATAELWRTVEALAAVRPDFISVTYGASGSTRATTRELVRRLLAETSVLPIAHLTCVGATRSEIVR